MAIPDSVTRWREFVAERVVEPEQLTNKQVLSLSPDEKNEYDDQRFAWIGADTVLETKDLARIDRHLRIIQARVSARSATAQRAFAISGRAGLGKSTTALTLGKRHERQRRKVLGNGVEVTPVVYAVVPPGATPKMLMRAFATWLGMQIPQRFDAPTITDQVVHVMAHQETSLVILDEVHNLRTSRSVGAEAASQLKVFTERVDAAFVYCGIDLLSSDLFTGDIGKQIRARTKMYGLVPYSIGSATDRDEWVELVLGMESLLPLTSHPEGSLEDEAAYLYHRTGGSIGSLRGLLGDAAIDAIMTGKERIDRSVLDEIILDEEAARQAARGTAPASGRKRVRRAR
ncbi:ATP-binding protein [Nesterenkonia sp. LB17]|uniref:ATP-binding protein n=1 Tax=Nesterenkonia sp. LB17 TaxID=2901230 RepID=UPI001F4CE672|nr:ATP-binding protein [Nesterenkonia sp. LB17]MCH8565209.1 ATP-binding protein [Nesterenkonia sp. LB17]